jgi:dTDP-4-dehydrorhamnose 3,5-epimerase
MVFTETVLAGAYLIELSKLQDERGFFARAWCAREFEQRQLRTSMVQANIGFSSRRGTLRGLHYQIAPHAEAKLVRCPRGAVYDVVVDLRPESPTHRQWLGMELSETNHRMLYVPEGFAHGYQTLIDDAELFYQTSQFFAAESARGVRYDDPSFKIQWPLEVQMISEKDRNWPDYKG